MWRFRLPRIPGVRLAGRFWGALFLASLFLAMAGVSLAGKTQHTKVAVGTQSSWTDLITGRSDCYNDGGYVIKAVLLYPDSQGTSQYQITCADGQTLEEVK